MTFNHKGTVFCHCLKTGEIREMAYNGFEKDRKPSSTCAQHLDTGLNARALPNAPFLKKAFGYLLKKIAVFLPR